MNLEKWILVNKLLLYSNKWIPIFKICSNGEIKKVMKMNDIPQHIKDSLIEALINKYKDKSPRGLFGKIRSSSTVGGADNGKHN